MSYRSTSYMRKNEFMDGYKVLSFQTEKAKKYLVIDAKVSIINKNQVSIQAFTLDGCYPFPVFFNVAPPEDKLIEEALVGAANNVKEIENWIGDETQEDLKSLKSNLNFLKFIRKNCESERLAKDIDKLLNLKTSYKTKVESGKNINDLNVDDMGEHKFVYQNKMESIEQKFNSIDKEKYLLIKSSYEFILKIIWIEDKYSILLDNFYEFEKSFYDIYLSLCEVDDDNKSNVLGQDGIKLLNRRLLNFLSTSKMYIDQLLHDTSVIAKNNKELNLYSQIKKQTSLIYDESLSYQLMEFIRNITQHRFLIIRGLHYAKLLFNSIEQCNHVPIFVNAYVRDLKKDSKFAKKIKSLDILEQYQSDDLNLVYHVREYIEGLSKIHYYFRDNIQHEIENCNKLINDNLDSLPAFNSSLAEIVLIEYDEDNNEKDGILIDQNILFNFVNDSERDILKFDGYFLNKAAVPCKKQVRFNNAKLADVYRNHA